MYVTAAGRKSLPFAVTMMQPFVQAASMTSSSFADSDRSTLENVMTREAGRASAAAWTSRSNRNRYGGTHLL